MRPIKFRAWDKTHKKWCNRVLAGPGDPCSIVWDDERKEWLNFDEFCGDIVQFTGLQDKNGQDIYEGDILSFSYDKSIRLRDEHVWPHEEFIVTPEERKCEVYWSDSAFKLFDHGKQDWMLLEVANVKEMAILGNIYENPHLVPQEKIQRHLKIIF